LGHGYSTLAYIPEDKGSWALPLCHERITSFETPITKAAFQLKQVCKNLEVRPITLWDSEYGNAKFLNLTRDIKADLLIRIRPNRCIFGKPKPEEKNKMVRPKIHGNKMKLSDPTTWSVPVEFIEIDDLTFAFLITSIRISSEKFRN
ncbi:MAG: transposase, partial [Prochloraceae cyanobacterium]|nr:transposase [Prochloraceae cyanobacterium]